MSEPPPPPESIASLAESLPAVPGFGTAQRLVESVLLAAATSTGLYLVGSVYTDAYYGRMSIDAASLDLAPPLAAPDPSADPADFGRHGPLRLATRVAWPTSS